jgi:hypothetical protein
MDRSDWRHAALSTRIFALLALVCVIGGVVGVTTFSRRQAEATGPHLMARNAAGDVLLGAFTTLYLVPHDEGVQVLDVEALDLRGPVLSLSSDGDHWYLGDDATGLLHRCDLAARRCEPAVTTLHGERAFRRTHRVAFTADRIHIADTSRHQLVIFDREGNFIAATRTGPIALCFPNGIVERQGALYVADTNNFRIARIDPAAHYPSETFLHVAAGEPVTEPNCSFDSARFGERGNALMNKAADAKVTQPREARAPARPDRAWPASVLNTSRDDWWVVQQTGALLDGDVVIYDTAGRPRRRIELPPDADPVDLIELDESVLIADPTLARVHRVSLDGARVDAWEPPDFAAQMQRALDTRWLMGLGRHASRGAIGLGVILGLVVVWRELRRKRAEGGWPSVDGLVRPAAPPAPLEADVVWIPIDPARLRGQRLAMLLVYALPVIFLIGGAILVFGAASKLSPRGFGAVCAVWLMGFVLLAAMSLIVAIPGRRVPRLRLGVSEQCLYFDRGNGRIVASPWADVRVDRQRLLIDRYLLQMINPLKRASWFVWEQVYTCLLPRIPPEGFVRGPRLVYTALRRGNRDLWIVMAMFLILILLSLNQHWLQSALRWLATLLTP